MQERYKTVDEYFRQIPEQSRKNLTLLRQLITKTAPEAIELISYSMPAFKLHGRILVYYAGYKGHIGLYPASRGVFEAFKDDLTGFKTSKGTIQFPVDTDLPVELIESIIRYRASENLNKFLATKTLRH